MSDLNYKLLLAAIFITIILAIPPLFKFIGWYIEFWFGK